MATLEETLKKLNKGKADEDKYEILGDKNITMEFSSSGSKYLDFYMKNNVVPLGAMTLLTGWESSGKTSISLIMVREIQKKTGKFGVILDGEQTITDSHVDRFNLDRGKTIIRQDSVLEEMLDSAEEFSKSEDVGVIMIDSIKAFFSTVVEEKSAGEFSIGIEAKRIGSRFAIINANCARRGIAFIVLNQWRENPGAMNSDPRVLPGGNWNKFMPFTHLDFTKKDFILDSNKDIVGHKLDVRIRKSKAGAYDKKNAITLDFFYRDGFNEVNEFARVFCETNIATVGGGGWTSFPNKDGEEKRVHGIDKFIEYLHNNPDDFNYLKSLI